MTVSDSHPISPAAHATMLCSLAPQDTSPRANFSPDGRQRRGRRPRHGDKVLAIDEEDLPGLRALRHGPCGGVVGAAAGCVRASRGLRWGGGARHDRVGDHDKQAVLGDARFQALLGRCAVRLGAVDFRGCLRAQTQRGS